MSFTDRERQEDEVEALSSIYNTDEFRCRKNESIECRFNLVPTIFEKQLTVKYMDFDENDPMFTSSYYKFCIEYLPPVYLLVELCSEYPSRKPPYFSLVISWLPPWETSLVCQKLDEIWEENEGNEILYLWCEFLKNELITFLNIGDTLDVSFMYLVHVSLYEYMAMDVTAICDNRAKNNALPLNPLSYLTQYSKARHDVVFQQSFQICEICLEEYIGHRCVEVKSCGHIYCRICTREYISIKIKDGNGSIRCPYTNCDVELEVGQIKDLCPDLYSKYEELSVRLALSTMTDVKYCPRPACQSPVLIDPDDTLATCIKCDYNFCVYCCKVYHGVAPCKMSSEDTLELIADYQNGDKKRKKQLQKKYGRKQIALIVENHLTKEYLKDNAKPCPNCQAMIAKIDGCNKMVCRHCSASFCWLCGKHITDRNAYDHFVINRSKCYGRLFEGLINTGEEFLDEEMMMLL